MLGLPTLVIGAQPMPSKVPNMQIGSPYLVGICRVHTRLVKQRIPNKFRSIVIDSVCSRDCNNMNIQYMWGSTKCIVVNYVALSSETAGSKTFGGY